MDVTEAALRPPVQPQDLERVRLSYEHEIQASKDKGRELLQHQSEYEELKKRLETLADRTSYSVMVPLTKKAFMCGRVIHTNEIMVLLGDNWFAEKSTKEAIEVCNRRLAKCQKGIADLKKEIHLYESWQKETTSLGAEGVSGSDGADGLVDIREPFDEEKERKWREEHRTSIKSHRLQNNQQQHHEAQARDDDDDDALFRRLDQLELEEELDEYMAGQAEASSSQPKGKISFGEVTQTTIDPSESVAAASTVRAEPIIKIFHSEGVDVKPADSAQAPQTPAELYARYGRKKSALKVSNSIMPKLESAADPVAATVKPTIMNTAVKDLVRETIAPLQNNDAADLCSPPKRTTSKFKQQRAMSKASSLS